MIKQGDWVRHKNGHYYQVKEINKNVVTLGCQQPYEATRWGTIIKIQLCLLMNIEPAEQLTITT